MFTSLSKKNLIKSALFKNSPVYVQFYVTARCNFTCKQCNVIYANSDVRECTLDEIKHIADNLNKIGVAIVLLTGGEPFLRNDLPEIIREFKVRGIHVRMQTNGTASEEKIQKAIAYGGNDISISLDSLSSKTQDLINGGIPGSWHRAIKTIAAFTKYLPKESSFASLGCVLQRDNIADVEDVIRFGTAISWFTSLVPVHVTDNLHPLSFRTYDQSLRFRPDEWAGVDRVIERVRTMRREGFLLYDSDQYLDDIKRFVHQEPTTWRRKRENRCDTPNLYFAILPNGDFAPCCDHRLTSPVQVSSPDFPSQYKAAALRNQVATLTGACSGCMYGSFPEMTISMRFLRAKLQRVRTFFTAPPEKRWPISYESLLEIAETIRKQKCGKDRTVS
jgi:MoaA/NifB/PqqE/SkfB family radical SAM enzyme